jgi:hypothetical protein
MHHAGSAAGEPAQPAEVEVERVEEAGRGPAGDPVELDLEATALELLRQGPEELMPAARWGRDELVEDGQVGSPPTRAQPVRLGTDSPDDAATRPSHCAHAAPDRHGDTVTSRRVDALRQPSRPGRSPPSAWEGVDELYVETHPCAACGADELARHLEPAGFTPRPSAHHAVLRLQRAGGSRAVRRSDPR